MTTLAGFLREMGTWIDTPQEDINRAEKSGINTDNSPRLRSLSIEWVDGVYDEDPDVLHNALTYLIPTE